VTDKLRDKWVKNLPPQGTAGDSIPEFKGIEPDQNNKTEK
jgi:hypothetical protein